MKENFKIENKKYYHFIQEVSLDVAGYNVVQEKIIHISILSRMTGRMLFKSILTPPHCFRNECFIREKPNNKSEILTRYICISGYSCLIQIKTQLRYTFICFCIIFRVTLLTLR